jgi:Arc/MetJ-type ribon-helix-helix transcriptional regulator
MSHRSVDLTLEGEFARIVTEAVESGSFGSPEDVVSEALTFWRSEKDAYDAELLSLRAEINAALDDPGPTYSIEEVRRHLALRRPKDEAA